MTISPDSWVETRAAVDVLGMSRSKLQELKKTGVLRAGEHWIKAGGAHGRLLWSVPAIRCWQIEQTTAAAEAPAPETYAGLPDGGAA